MAFEKDAPKAVRPLNFTLDSKANEELWETPNMRRLRLATLLLLGLAVVAAAQEAQTLQRGRELTRLFYDEGLGTLWERFAAPMQDLFGSLQGLKRFREQVGLQFGREVSLVSERVDFVGTTAVYERTARFEKPSAPILLQWSLARDGTVAGFLVTPVKEAPSKYLEYQTKTDLRLPFRGNWYVFWGGRALSQNYHARVRDQRFAYDFLIMKNGSSHAGKGEKNADYYCFGQPILAPGSGTVVSVENGVEDNVPGVMNARQPLGNHVIIDHGNGEFSFLAHLRRGSVKVKEGDQVEAGDLLGECGNSGYSSEPHLHYHLQDTGEPFKGDGLPAQFRDYIANGQPVARGEPVQGQQVIGSNKE
jgi:murein DD-endopeptidase MepM/ murein hydrolase activator NlpD